MTSQLLIRCTMAHERRVVEVEDMASVSLGSHSSSSSAAELLLLLLLLSESVSTAEQGRYSKQVNLL